MHPYIETLSGSVCNLLHALPDISLCYIDRYFMIIPTNTINHVEDQIRNSLSGVIHSSYAYAISIVKINIDQIVTATISHPVRLLGSGQFLGSVVN
jgi:hypothetical protein